MKLYLSTEWTNLEKCPRSKVKLCLHCEILNILKQTLKIKKKIKINKDGTTLLFFAIWNAKWNDIATLKENLAISYKEKHSLIRSSNNDTRFQVIRKFMSTQKPALDFIFGHGTWEILAQESNTRSNSNPSHWSDKAGF